MARCLEEIEKNKRIDQQASCQTEVVLSAPTKHRSDLVALLTSQYTEVYNDIYIVRRLTRQPSG